MIVLKTEWSRSKEMEKQLHKAIKGSIKLFFQTNQEEEAH